MGFLPDSVSEWFSAIGVLIAGGIALFYFFRKETGRQEQLVDQNQERLITVLKDQRDAADRDLKVSMGRLDTLTMDYAKATQENKTLKEIALGRDANSLELNQRAQEAMVQISQILQISTSVNVNMQKTNENVEKTNQNVERLYRVIEQLVGKMNDRLPKIAKKNRG